MSVNYKYRSEIELSNISVGKTASIDRARGSIETINHRVIVTGQMRHPWDS